MKFTGHHISKQAYRAIRYKTYSVICLSILLFYLVRPLLPFVEYAINKDYISKNICINRNNPRNCCQGKCYLDEQLKKSAEAADYNSNNNKKYIPDQRLEDHLKADEICVPIVEKKISMISYYPLRVILFALLPVFVPPKF
jgi:hypothetical protein